MGMFSSINIASSGMSAQSLLRDVISDNIANANTTQTQEGGAFKRSRVIMASRKDSPDFRTAYLPGFMNDGAGNGVEVKLIEKDNAPGRLVYDPTHPNAIQSGPKAGYVEYPNVNIVTEMVDLIAASRAYEANASVIQGSKDMFMKALEIAKV